MTDRETNRLEPNITANIEEAWVWPIKFCFRMRQEGQKTFPLFWNGQEAIE